MAEKRLQQLQIRFFKDYREFMEECIVKGYERMSIKEVPVGTTWYILHNGVYHANKSSKICVVFNCSAKFRGHH